MERFSDNARKGWKQTGLHSPWPPSRSESTTAVCRTRVWALSETMALSCRWNAVLSIF